MNHLRVLTCSFIFFPFRFDPDKEIGSLEKQEEEEKKKKTRKARILPFWRQFSWDGRDFLTY